MGHPRNLNGAPADYKNKDKIAKRWRALLPTLASKGATRRWGTRRSLLFLRKNGGERILIAGRGLFLDRGRNMSTTMSTTTGKISTRITVAELKDEISAGRRPHMIDVRSASEYAGGHIPCAINIPMEQFEARRKDLRLEEELVLVCKTGSRSQIVAGWLGENPKVRGLEGGTEAWTRAGLEVVTSSKTRWSLERQVRLVAGLLVLAATVLAVAGVHGTIWVAMFVGAGLTFAGATDICMMGIVLAGMPWNKARAAKAQNPRCG